MVTFEGSILLNSGAGVLFQGVYWDAPMWLPRSQVEIEPDDIETSSVVVKVKDWLAGKKRLMEFTHYSAQEIQEMDAI